MAVVGGTQALTVNPCLRHSSHSASMNDKDARSTRSRSPYGPGLTRQSTRTSTKATAAALSMPGSRSAVRHARRREIDHADLIPRGLKVGSAAMP